MGTELVQADFRRVIRVGDVGESKVGEHANIVVIWLTVRDSAPMVLRSI